MRFIVIGLMLVAGLAGCADGDGATLGAEDTPSENVVDVGNGIRVAENRGALSGTVHSDTGEPVDGARVALRGSSEFQITPFDGTFRFTNLTVGDHELRIEKQGFLVHERSVSVAPGTLAEVHVTLVPDLQVGAGYRPHVHNMWGSATEVTLMDEGVPLLRDTTDPNAAAGAAQDAVLAANFERQGSYDTFIPLPDAVPEPGPGMQARTAALVFPGTTRIEVTFTWDMETSNLDRLALGYHNATTDDVAYLELHASGEPWVIDVRPDETDNGHQAFSLWGFFMNPLNEITRVPDGYRGPAYLNGDLNVKIVVFRGDVVPLEPAHPVFWDGNDTLVLRPGDDAHEMNPAVTVIYRDERSPSHFDINLPTLVPPGTKLLRVTFSWVHDQFDQTVPGTDWSLTWRTAAQHPYLTPFEAYGRSDPVEGDWLSQRKVYEIPVAPEETDAFYQQRSIWGFLLSREGTQDDSLYLQEHRWRDTSGPEFFLEVVAFKDPETTLR